MSEEDKEIEEFFRQLGEETLRKGWDNPADERAAEWYKKNAKRLVRLCKDK